MGVSLKLPFLEVPKSYRYLTLSLLGFFFCISPVKGQAFVPINEQSPNLSVDTLKSDSNPDSAKTDQIELKASSDGLDATINYNAEDSIIYDLENEIVYLYGKAYVSYKQITLSAHKIIFNMAAKHVDAEGGLDSLGNTIGKPLFSEGNQKFSSASIQYNFETKKGKIVNVVTKEGDGFMHVDSVKQIDDQTFYGSKASYTTCEHEEPHFYLSSEKVKVVTDNLIVTGPANFVVEDVPTPLWLPFGIFPIKKGQRSGLILPSYGQSPNRGFFFSGGGYYFAINDYMDLQMRGDLYTKGSWALKPIIRYNKRYKYNGNLYLDYARNTSGKKFTQDFGVSRDFKVRWSHFQDPKAWPNSGFNASVEFGNSSYDQNNNFDNEQVLDNSYQSSISYQKNWPGTPFNMTLSANHDQSTKNKTVNVSFPNLTFGMSQIKPLERKVRVGKKQWYENLTVRYSLNARNDYNSTDSTFLQENFVEEFRNGAKHQIPINLNLKLFKYLQFTPRVNYNEVWYLKTVRDNWNTNSQSVDRDTILDFRAGRWFDAGASLNTVMFGVMRFNGKLKAIRHVFKPTLRFTWQPDFANPDYGYYGKTTYNNSGSQRAYSIFQGGIYGGPPSGKQARINYGFNNQIEAKVFSRKDTLKNEQKIKLFDYVNLNGSYNIAADSFQWSDVTTSAGLNFLQNKINLRFSSRFDLYDYDTSVSRSKDVLLVKQKGAPARLENANISFSTALRSQKSEDPIFKEQQYLDEGFIYNPRGYVDFEVPWNMSLNYNLGLNRTNSINIDSFSVIQSLSGNFDFNLSPKWKVALNGGYDFKEKELTRPIIDLYRDLHCWELNFSLAPLGAYQYYRFTLKAKSSLLQDLKLNRRRNWQDYDFR